MHGTFTQTGTFVAVPLNDPSLPSYTGRVTIWGGFNANGTTVNGTFTFNVRATGSDGSTSALTKSITSTSDPTAPSTSSSTATRFPALPAPAPDAGGDAGQRSAGTSAPEATRSGRETQKHPPGGAAGQRDPASIRTVAATPVKVARRARWRLEAPSQ